ncbi:hypothetical protein QE152_g15841 [Popillia japonica]|uniref:Uncharacterized protein n=1 Tax=Popillia japonica TaxID=7064 RepID=A0AAW1L6Q6_POPJA
MRCGDAYLNSRKLVRWRVYGFTLHNQTNKLQVSCTEKYVKILINQKVECQRNNNGMRTEFLFILHKKCRWLIKQNFLEEDYVVLNKSVKSKEGNIAMPIIVQSPKAEKMDFRINNNMLVSLCETSNVVNETPTNLADQYLYSSKSKQKRKELHTSNRKSLQKLV